MKPRPSPQEARQRPTQLFQLELRGLVNPHHPLVVLAHEVKWQQFDEAFGANYSDLGRPGISTRLMVALHYLKYQHDLSDEAVVAQWLENPYWQFEVENPQALPYKPMPRIFDLETSQG
jgi:transposase, IS5 family